MNDPVSKAERPRATKIELRNTVQDACDLLKLSRAALYVRISEGRLNVTKDGHRTFISGGELQRYMSACESASL
ncbi:MAG: helix-turn-helix domain-containing protein [Myxococcaceae bacterium]|nr:helix-turn-helix domain-containing protein [Myxococcaceae bacterium]